MKIRVGYDLIYWCPQATPMILNLCVHHSRVSDLVRQEELVTDPPVPMSLYRDGFGNWCHRLVAPPGRIRFRSESMVHDSGAPEATVWDAVQHPVEDLPAETLVYLLGSRYCETDLMNSVAWNEFGHIQGGWNRVQAVCDFVNRHLTFGYQWASPTKSAWQAYNEKQGVCRDFAHLAITLCRCLNIPARYCTAYLGDIGVPLVDAPMDFAGSFEAYVGGQWHPFDPRNNQRRIGRILIARGRDASDVAITTTYGPHTLERFLVIAEEVAETEA